MRIRMITFVLACTTMGSELAIGQVAGTRMAMVCQQNRDDARLLVANGNMLPRNWGFKILRYRPTATDGDWTTGPCTVQLTKPLTGANRLDY